MRAAISTNANGSTSSVVKCAIPRGVVTPSSWSVLHPTVEEAQRREVGDLGGSRLVAELYGGRTAALELGPLRQAGSVGIAAAGKVHPIGLQPDGERAILRCPGARQDIERAEAVGILRAVERPQFVGRVDLRIGLVRGERLRMIEEVEIGRLAMPARSRAVVQVPQAKVVSRKMFLL